MASYNPFANLPARYSTRDGSVDFYLRVRSFLKPNSVVLDLGAGRGAWFEDDTNSTRRYVRDIRPVVGELVAADTDPAVHDNRSASRTVLIEGDKLPFQDASFDVIICDFVLEHISDPAAFVRNVRRVLKPGGVFCARTPHSFNYVSLIARLIPNKAHAKSLSRVQPDRKDVDVFPTQYKLNTKSAVAAAFSGWEDQTMIYRGDPAYFFGSKLVYSTLDFVHRIAPSVLVGTLFVFMISPKQPV